METGEAGDMQLGAKIMGLHCTDASKAVAELTHPHFFSVQEGQELVDFQYSASSSAGGVSSAVVKVGVGAARIVCAPALAMSRRLHPLCAQS